MNRPQLKIGNIGSQVKLLQACFPEDLEADGVFGNRTDSIVRAFQDNSELESDGIVGPATWSALDAAVNLPPYPPPLPELFSREAINDICEVASNSPISTYPWKDRGTSPRGYINGMAVAFAVSYSRWLNADTITDQMAKANTGNDSVDAISWYNSNFLDFGMSNYQAGPDTLRHLYVLMIGLGMRESSGKYCEGRDMSAENVSSDTAEAGLFQMSWNARSCCTDMQVLFDQYSVAEEAYGYEDIFKAGVSCSSQSWACYGSGAGYAYQEMAKDMPVFAAETTAIGLRNLRQHWGPINRKEAELRSDADFMLQEVQAIIVGLRPSV